MFLYLFIISLIAAGLFVHDKQAALHQRKRVPEKVLHLIELLGGVFIILLLMPLIHHKNSKKQYNRVTLLILLLWIGLLWLLRAHNIIH